jgi:hypothetical protein
MHDNEYLTHLAVIERLGSERRRAAAHRLLMRATPRTPTARLAAYGAVASSWINRWRNWRPAYRSRTPMRSSRPWARLSEKNSPETP